MNPLIKENAVHIIKKLGLGKIARAARSRISPNLRAQRKRNLADLNSLSSRLQSVRQQIEGQISQTEGNALFIAMGGTRYVVQQLPVIAGVIAHGLSPIIILPSRDANDERMLYEACGIKRFAFWDDYADNPDIPRLLAALANCMTQDDVLNLTWNGLMVGKYAVSTLMRQLRSGHIDIQDQTINLHMQVALQRCLNHASASKALLAQWSPKLVVFVDRGYTPEGPLFEACIQSGIQPITFNAAHKDNALLLKRYGQENSNVHPASLAQETWQALQAMPWDQQKFTAVQNEIEHCYKTGQWYGEVATQHNTALLDRAKLKQRLGFNNQKKTVLLFPHIFWDATFFWGNDVFHDYEEWFAETVKAAWRLDHVNWVIKVHPANVVKNIRDGSSKMFAELEVLARFGPVPQHIRVLPADTDISTLSVFTIGDVCLTVRGTVGIEAATFGLNVITAGTGRYDRLGFTHDIESREEYLQLLSDIDKLSPPSLQQIELAQRYAYGVFINRPLQIESIPFSYSKTRTAELEVQISQQAEHELFRASDIRAIKAWLDSGKMDLCGIPPG